MIVHESEFKKPEPKIEKNEVVKPEDKKPLEVPKSESKDSVQPPTCNEKSTTVISSSETQPEPEETWFEVCVLYQRALLLLRV